MVHVQHGEVPTYVLLSALTLEGRKTLKERPYRIGEVNKEVEGFGTKILS